MFILEMYSLYIAHVYVQLHPKIPPFLLRFFFHALLFNFPVAEPANELS